MSVAGCPHERPRAVEPPKSDRNEGHAKGTRGARMGCGATACQRRTRLTCSFDRSGRPGSNRHGQLGRLGLYH
jgi:hypothetical protein